MSGRRPGSGEAYIHPDQPVGGSGLCGRVRGRTRGPGPHAFRRAHPEGGYEVEEAPLAYRISGTFDPGCEEKVTSRSIDMVASLWGRC